MVKDVMWPQGLPYSPINRRRVHDGKGALCVKFGFSWQTITSLGVVVCLRCF